MNLKFRAKKAITNPKTGGCYFLRKNMWWIVDKDDNPIYYAGNFPQCHDEKLVIENLLDKYRNDLPLECKVKFYENIFEPGD